MRFYNFSFIILLFLFNSCAYKKIPYNEVAKNVHVPIFIQMPKNVLVFDEISLIVYRSLWDYFNSVGYELLDNDLNACVLKVKIKNLEPVYKFISPDVLMYNRRIKLELLCEAFDMQRNLLAQKTFCFYALISRPNDPIKRSDFLEFEYRKLMHKAVPKIEQYFRRYWLKQ